MRIESGCLTGAEVSRSLRERSGTARRKNQVSALRASAPGRLQSDSRAATMTTTVWPSNSWRMIRSSLTNLPTYLPTSARGACGPGGTSIQLRKICSIMRTCHRDLGLRPPWPYSSGRCTP
jgi:hypothetical protein